MKPWVRNILASLATGCLIALFVVILTVDRTSAQYRSCQGLKVAISDSARLSFVSGKDIQEYMEEYGPYVGQRLPDVNLRKMEDILSHKSAIRNGEAWLDRDGYVHIEVTQREPAIRIQKGEKGFYADEKGYIFPLQENYTSRVPIIDGAVPVGDKTDSLWLKRVIRMVDYMKENGWSTRISQISVRPGGDLVMIPAQGKERFLFGSPTGIEAKFGRIKTYYEAVAPAQEEGYYSHVDVRYDKQIICKK